MAMGSRRSPVGLASTLENDCDKMNIIVKFCGNQSYFIDINTKKTIRDLKEIVAEKSQTCAGNINFVLAGQILSDSSILEECGLGAQTTIHAFCWSDDGLGAGDPTSKDNTLLPLSVPNHSKPATAIDWQGSDVDGYVFGATGTSGTSRLPVYQLSTHQSDCIRSYGSSRFFVYCKLCGNIRPAKLRLSCKECGSGAFVVDRGPGNWDDISPSTTIRGTCKSRDCTCLIPRFYLRCTENHEGDVEGTSVALKHVQVNRRRVECIICQDIITPILIFPCLPGHVICLECFRQYSSSCLGERRFIEHPQHGYTLPCPAGCEDSHIEETHHFLLMGPEKYERYKNFGAEEYVLQNGGILCPARGCGMGLFPEGDDRRLKCGECQFESCKECRREYHQGDCEEYLTSLRLNPSDLSVDDDRALRACWERQSLSVIEDTTKPCPGCQTKTERSGGCMHMICSRCNAEWCWLCVKPWDRDCQGDHWFG